ncbi:MAG: ABC transporter ATP-binding protein/permease [Desulfovibrio sp.]|jgi:ATP-binding cassette subfamily B protein|nr:ABC transporter ATP-binding protein/permease [Desulfovibrio sp.]
MEEFSRPGIGGLFRISGAKKLHLGVSAALAVTSSFLALATPVIIYLALLQMLAPGFGQEQYGEIRRLGLFAVLAACGRYVLLFASLMASHVAAFDILYHLRSTLCAHLGTLPMGWFTARQTGAVKKILSEDVEELEQFIAHHIPDIVTGAAQPLIIVAFLFALDWRLALAALLPLPLAFVLQWRAFGSGKGAEYRAEYHNALEDMNGSIVEYIRGMPVVKIFNQTVESFTRMKAAALAYKYFIEKITLAMAPPWAMFVVVTSSGLLFILPFGLWLYFGGDISLPVLFLFLLLGSAYMAPVFKLAMMGGQLRHLLEGLKRVEAVLREPPVRETPDPRTPEGNSVEFRNVSFRYGQRRVISDLSFFLPEGTLTALVGPSGAGKSTVGRLLLRMWDAEEGEILIGGVNIRDMSTRDLMDRVAFVFQEGFVFSDTVRENIRMGKEDASEEDVLRAAEAARCLDFIRKLPKGLDTVIGEGGEVHLSGGEAQRLAMARIILKNAPIVVLDEATAFTDAENEAKIQDAFASIMQGKTVMVIAHRLSTITDANAILVIRDGRVEQRGTHAELAREEGLYAAMWRAHTAARDWRLQTEEKPC